jgi:hypothetical protein
LRYTYFCNELINVLTNGGGYERNFRRIYRAKKNRAVRKKNDSFVYCFCGFGSGFIFGGVMNQKIRTAISVAHYYNTKIDKLEERLKDCKAMQKSHVLSVHDIAKEENLNEEQWADVIQFAKELGVTL